MVHLFFYALKKGTLQRANKGFSLAGLQAGSAFLVLACLKMVRFWVLGVFVCQYGACLILKIHSFAGPVVSLFRVLTQTHRHPYQLLNKGYLISTLKI